MTVYRGQKKIFLIVAFFTLLVTCSSCVNQLGVRHELTCRKKISLYLNVPENKLAFENLAPVVYAALWNHFDRVGFVLANSNHLCDTLQITIQNVDASRKYLSPDLLTYSMMIKIEIRCELLDINQKIKAQKVFSFVSLISPPKDYIMNSEFLDFAFRQVLMQQAYKIDQFLRPYLEKTA